MKRLLTLFILTLSLMACKIHDKNKDKMTETETPTVTKEMMESAVIYEANIRQYSPEGNFDAFTKDLPELKKMGVKIIWLMPIYPISEVNRKAKGDLFVHDIQDPEERKKYLGSYYAVADYSGVNPEFGTLEDLKELVQKAHELGMSVILDWVPNHSGWDNKWIKSHPEYYVKNSEGKITFPLNDKGESIGWDDVADLDYNNPEMRNAMIESMQYWLKEADVDGFRCDVAGMVPMDFWQQAVPQLCATKPIFMLAEDAGVEIVRGDDMFDMIYGWEAHHMMKAIAKGEKNVHDWDKMIDTIKHHYENNDIIMNFTQNHDENSWNGSQGESFGDAGEVMSVLSYMMPGMPLIYSGMEYDMNHRLKFFEKDLIPKTKGKYFPLYEKLGTLKNTNIALNGGKIPAAYIRINTHNNDKVLAFTREKDSKKVIFIANLSNQPIETQVELTGNFKDYFTGNTSEWKPENKITLQPWQYFVLE